MFYTVILVRRGTPEGADSTVGATAPQPTVCGTRACSAPLSPQSSPCIQSAGTGPRLRHFTSPLSLERPAMRC